MKILFLGGGNMANALIGGMLKQGFAATDIHVIDPGADARAKLSAAYAVNCHAGPDSAPGAPDLLLLAVKPQQMKEAVAPLVSKLGAAVVVSIAAGLDMAARDCSRTLLGLSHERTAAYDAKPMGRAMNPPNPQTGD